MGKMLGVSFGDNEEEILQKMMEVEVEEKHSVNSKGDKVGRDSRDEGSREGC